MSVLDPASHVVKAVIRSVVILLLGCVALYPWPAAADQARPADQTRADTSPSADDSSKTEQLETIVVTGSLIPQTHAETATPVTVITAQDMQARGFSTVADALQQSSFATGSVGNPQVTDQFTPGAQTLSMFGLSPSYVKYLIDGRPMSDYPELYNGNEIIASLGGIPSALVDHIDILPGGQSSLYGSDAIAGVVNVVLKKTLDAPVIDVRYSFYQDGGGADRRFTLADGLTLGAFHLLAGVQYENTDPIWGYQRELTSRRYTAGASPQTAEPDYLVYGFSATGNETSYFLDPNNCAHVASQFGGTVKKSTRAGIGSYCGTTNAGYYTIGNGNKTVQGYLHGTYDVTDHLQLYSDLLLNHEDTTFNYGAQFYTTGFGYGNYYDPNLGNLVNLQRLFSPEEAGGLKAVMDSVLNNSYRTTLGGQGSFGGSSWTYDVAMSRTADKLIRHIQVLFDQPIESFFSTILGPNLGPDPILGFYPTFTPNYAAFYRPLTPAQYGSFSGYVESHAQTAENLFRAQLTNPSLFYLPGGKAGFALAVEAGDQQWSNVPDPAFLDGALYGQSAVTGSGHRSRYAVTAELRLPLLKMLTVTDSVRYDDYKVSGQNVDKVTDNLGLELRPLDTLLLRGRYGTAFKAPTLADEFEGKSTYSSQVTDYYQCAQQGYTGTSIGSCPYYLTSYEGSTSGNPHLKPITADVWDIGAVWAPLRRMSISIDYLHWRINNEVAAQSADKILRTESLCRLGTYDISSPTCVAALSEVTRDASGALLSVYTPDANVSEETLNVVTAGVNYSLEVGRIGGFALEASWSDLLKHTYQQYPGDPTDNLVTDPTQSTDFKSKTNASVTWSKGPWGSTVYVNRYGRSPNYLATVYGYGTPGAATLSTWTLCNISMRYQWRTLQLSLAVDNVFNTMPPADHSYPGFTSVPYNNFNYNVYGRSYLFEASYTFGK